MKTFSNQIDLTAYWEQGHNGGPALKAYKCPAGVLTLGYGTTIKGIAGDYAASYEKVKEGDTCTPDQALAYLQKDFNHITNELCKYVKFGGDQLEANISYAQLMAVTDYAYNCGIKAFPTLISYLKAGNIESASEEFLNGFYANKQPLMGLLLRRISEYHTFTTGEYCAFELNDPISAGIVSLLLLKNGHNDAAVEMINRLKVKA